MASKSVHPATDSLASLNLYRSDPLSRLLIDRCKLTPIQTVLAAIPAYTILAPSLFFLPLQPAHVEMNLVSVELGSSSAVCSFPSVWRAGRGNLQRRRQDFENLYDRKTN